MILTYLLFLLIFLNLPITSPGKAGFLVGYMFAGQTNNNDVWGKELNESYLFIFTDSIIFVVVCTHNRYAVKSTGRFEGKNLKQ